MRFISAGSSSPRAGEHHSGGAGFRARKGDRAFRIGILASFVALFLLPLLGVSIYWGLIASKQYSTGDEIRDPRRRRIAARCSGRHVRPGGVAAVAGYADCR